MDREEIFRAIEFERDRQDNLHPLPKLKQDDQETKAVQNLFIAMDFLAVLVEEMGEVGSALQGDGDLREELVQVASVCVRWLEFMDK